MIIWKKTTQLKKYAVNTIQVLLFSRIAKPAWMYLNGGRRSALTGAMM
jgi:hypothetical protein